MKKNVFMIGTIVLLIACFAATGSAYEYDTAFSKLGRGLANIVTAPGEMYTQPILLSNDYDPVTSLIGGFLKGVGMFAVRECVGVYDVVTFALPFPRDYRPLIQPATTFTNWQERKP